MSDQLFIGGINVLLALIALVFWAAAAFVLIEQRSRPPARRKPAPRRKARRRKSRFWKKAGALALTIAKGIGKVVRGIAGAGWFVLSHLPGWIGSVLKWMLSKIAILIQLLLILLVYGFAMALALTAFDIGAQTQYAGLYLVEFVKWGLLGVAAIVAVAVTIPLFGVVRRLVS